MTQSSREQAREIAKEWTNASKRQKWGDYQPGDIHNMLENMIDGFEDAEAQLLEAEARLAIAVEVLEFYGDRDHWWKDMDGENTVMDCDDTEFLADKMIVVAGKRAREAIKRMKEVGGEG